MAADPSRVVEIGITYHSKPENNRAPNRILKPAVLPTSPDPAAASAPDPAAASTPASAAAKAPDPAAASTPDPAAASAPDSAAVTNPDLAATGTGAPPSTSSVPVVGAGCTVESSSDCNLEIESAGPIFEAPSVGFCNPDLQVESIAGPVPKLSSTALPCTKLVSLLDPSAGAYEHHSAEVEADTLAGSTTSDAGVSHVAAALLEVPPDTHSSLHIEVIDPDITPESISRIVQKYSLDRSPDALAGTSTAIQEVPLDCSSPVAVLNEDQTPSSDSDDEDPSEKEPLYLALQQLLHSDGSRQLFQDLHAEHRQLVADFLHKCWKDISEENFSKFRSASPLGEAKNGFTHDDYLLALQLVFTVESSRAHGASLSSEEEKVVFGFLSSLLKSSSNCTGLLYCNQIEFLVGIHGNAFLNPSEEPWREYKSGRRRNAASKKNQASHN